MAFLERNANRGSISTGYDIDNSLKLESDNTEHLYVTTMTSGNRRTWTYSIWFKRTELGFTNVLIHFGVTNQATRMMIDDTDQLFVDMCDTGSTLYRSITNRFLRDTSAWYHVVLRVDTTQSTEADRMRVYINGVEETSWEQHQIPPQNLDTLANTTAGAYDAMGIGTYVWAGGSYDGNFSGYIAQVAHVDGQSYAPTEFGEFDDSGIWKPKDITELTYGSSNNSFLLDFSNSSDLGNDSSGNNNDWSLTNIAAADQTTDTPTNNFCTLNRLWVYGNALTTGPIEGATKVSGGGWAGTKATMGVDNGKWYWEYKSSNSSTIIGIQTDEGVALTGNAHNILSTCALYLDGEVWIKDSTSGRNDTDVTQTFSSSSVYGIALNMDDNQISFYQDGSLITNGGNIALDGLADKTVFPFASNYNSTQEFNFGGYTTISISSAATDANGYGTFEYAPPSGYYALCTKNLAEYG